MIHTQNSVTQPISRLGIIMNKLINENEESFSCQPLTNPYIPNFIDWTQESCYFGNQDSISVHPLELDQTHVLKITLTFWKVNPFLELKLNMKVILNLKLVILFHFLIQ